MCPPDGLAMDSAGNLYESDASDGRVRKITPAGTISLFAGGGPGCSEPCPATQAQLFDARGMAFDSAGDLFIADAGDIKKVDLSGNITTVAGNGTLGYMGDGGAATSAELNGPRGVVVDGSGNLYIADTFHHRIR